MEDIVASDIFMDNVICPISINMFYRCGSNDPALYSLEKQPVGEDTPLIRKVLIERVKAENCRCAAAFLAGLPEMPLQNIVVKDCTFKVKKELESGLEAEMCAGIPESDFRGIRVINSDVKFDNISVDTDPMIKYEEY